MEINDFIEKKICKLQVTDRIEEASRILSHSNMTSLPVVKKGKFVGMFDQNCIRKNEKELDKVINKNVKAISNEFDLEDILEVKSSVVPIIDKEQNFIGVTRPQKIIQTLLLNLKLYSSVIENSNDGMLVIDKEGEIQLVNQALVRLSGVPKEDYINHNIREIIDKGIFKKNSVTLRVLKEKKSLTDFQQYQNNIDVLVKAIPLFDENSKLDRVLANVHDVTELMKSKKELEKIQILSETYQKKFYKLIEDSNHAGTVVASPQMIEIMNLVNQVAATDSTIIIYGESGVGKEIISNEIHQKSKRKNKAFIKVNCGAIPKELLESEFFGYESGAFTGAKQGGKKGLFELAHEGTLFLDEIGELPIHLQSKLLRFFQERTLTRVGGNKEIKVDVRLISATNQNLEKMISEGNFREDLYYRLNVIPISLPPLRERKEEIVPLVVHYLKKFNREYEKKRYITTSAMEVLQNYSWKGNIRELANLMERLVLTVKSDEIHINDLPSGITKETKQDKQAGQFIFNENKTFSGNMFEATEKQLIHTFLEKHGSIRKTAKALGVSHTTLMRKMKKYDIKLSFLKKVIK